MVKQKRVIEAIEIIQEGIDSLPNIDGYTNDAKRPLMVFLARLLNYQRRFPEAQQVYYQLPEANEKQFEEVQDWTFRSLQTEAETTLKEGRYAEAETLMAKGYETCRKSLGRGHPLTISYGLKMDKVRRQLWQQEKGLSVNTSISPEMQDTHDAKIDYLEFQTALGLEPPIKRLPILPRYLMSLAWSYREKSRENRDPRYLDIGIDKFETAILVGSESDTQRHRLLYSLGEFYKSRFRARNTLDDLRRAIEAKETAMKLQDEACTDRPRDLSALCVCLIELHERDSTLESLDRGIQLGEEILSLTAFNNPQRVPYMKRQSVALLLRYESIGGTQDFDRSTKLMDTAGELSTYGGMTTTSEWSQTFLDANPDLARSLVKIDGKIENQDDIKNRMATTELQTILDDASLSKSFKRHFARIQMGSRSENLDEAVRVAERAVELQKHDQESRYQADCLMRLGYLLVNRFDAKGDQEDLDRGIMHLEKARNAFKPNPIIEARCLSGMAGAFRFCWERTTDQNSRKSLEAAIHHGRLALELLSDKDMDKMDVIHTLATYLIDKFKVTHVASDIDEAVGLYEMALSLPRASTHIHHPRILNCLADTLETKFANLGDVEDLNSAIEKSEQAVSVTYAEDPSRAKYCLCLAAKYHTRYLNRHDQKDLDYAAHQEMDGWRSINGTSADRLLAGSRAIDSLMGLERFDEATTIAMEVIDLLDLREFGSQNIASQQLIVKLFPGIGATTCSLLLRAGRCEDALGYLDRGRTIILNQLIFNRLSDEILSTLPAILKLKNKAAQIIPGPKDMSYFHKVSEIIAEFPENELEEAIWSSLGQTQVLSQPDFETSRSAKWGIIVTVNITTIRSDAIIRLGVETSSLELPELTHYQTRKWLEKGLTRRAKDRAIRREQNEEYTSFLRWIWVSGVKPIFDHIKLPSQISTRTESLPRVFWIGTGVASMLPFHAACDRTSNATENTFSYAISSYSSSNVTLFPSGPKLSDGFFGPQPSLLMVGMPTTRGHKPLPGVEEEIEEIKKAVDPSFSVKSLLRPTPARVLSDLVSYDVVHFACHAQSDNENPFNGHLLLESESSATSESDRCEALTVESIIKLESKRARIAYLSACSTAESRAPKLLDEAIHLASAFRVAGFSHVLGTMWQAPDLTSREIAVGFYRHLVALLTEPGVDNDRAVAEAFHLAVNKVRSEYEENPLLWAQFVHYAF